MTKENNVLLFRVAQKSFEEATGASLGATFHIIIEFHLKQKFGKDPYEVLIKNPTAFYEGLKEVLGEGAEAVISLAGTYLAAKYKIYCSVDEFIGIFTKNSSGGAEQLAEIFKNVIAQEEKKLKLN
jgi:hypothetical protein